MRNDRVELELTDFRNTLLHLEWKRRKALIFYSKNVTMKIQDVIKQFKFEKFPILMKSQRHSSWRVDSLRNGRNSKRKRHNSSANSRFSHRQMCSTVAYSTDGVSKESTALWCYSMIINMYQRVE